MPTSPRNATRVELLLALTCANLLGCAGGASAPPAPTFDPTPAPREAKAAPPTGPAFVVYTPRSTLVVPVAGGAPIAEAEGLWVLDDATTPPAVRVFLPEVPEGLAPCDGERASETSCEPMPILYEGGPVCDCLPVEPELPSEPGDALDGEPDSAEDESECASMYTAPAALVGGSLFTVGSSHSMCGGMNVYDAAGAEHPMVEAPFEFASFARQLEAKGCTVDVPAGEPAPVSDHDRLECASPGQAPRADGSEQCFDCERLSPETETWTLSRGRLVRVEDNIFHAGGARWVSDMRVGPARCPTAADTCGPPGLYPGIGAAEGFWIATDGSAALTIARRQVRVFRPGGHGLSPFELREREIIGVRFHREARALLGAMRDGAPRTVR